MKPVYKEDLAENVTHRRRANRMRWCRGKPGVEHDWHPIRCVWGSLGGYEVRWSMTICRACRKHRYI